MLQQRIRFLFLFVTSRWWNITWDDTYYHGLSPPVSVSHINLRHRLIRFPINFYSSLIHHNNSLIIITAMSSEDISMQPIPSGPSMLDLSSRFSIDTADIIEAHRLHNIVHFLPPPILSVSTLPQSSTLLGSEVPEDETLTQVPMWFRHGSQMEVVPCGITTRLRGLSDLDQPVNKLMTSRTSEWRNTSED